MGKVMLQKDPCKMDISEIVDGWIIVKYIFLKGKILPSLTARATKTSLDLCLQPEVLAKTSPIYASFGCEYVEQKS